VVRLLAALMAATLALTACSRDDEEPEAAEPEPAVEQPEPEPENEPEDEAGPTGPISPLTGEILDEERLEQALLIIKVDNAPAARPQSGLDVADVVIEELVEGGITRFMALLHSEVPDVAGPIRSARPVDAELVAGYGASAFAFSGARGEVQGMLAGTPSVRITEGGAGYFRDRSRRAPHNLYIRPAETIAAAMDRGAVPITEVEIGWRFDDEPPVGELTCPPDAEACEDPGGAITIAMSQAYRTGWVYDEAEGVYRRLQNGQDFLVTGEGRIGAANVVVLGSRHYIGPTGYPETDARADDNPAVVLRDGKRYEARWSKPSASDPIRLFDTAGEPFPLKPGPTWLHLPSVDRMPDVTD
jgi:hypothetical protein